MEEEPITLHIHLVSDSTGETVSAVLEAASSMFPVLEPQTHLHPFVRTRAALDEVIAALEAEPGPVFCSIADTSVSSELSERAARLQLEVVDVLAPVVSALSRVGGSRRVERPGSQYRVDAGYLERVAALDYAISHDDGLSPDYLLQADVILVGVSRTSKTPTCIYLAYQGIRAANVPLVHGEAPPEGLFEAQRAGLPVIGLTASPQRLAQIRRHRLSNMEIIGENPYADIHHIRDEVTDARLFFEKHGIPMIDVTRRSIEETAAAVRVLLRRSRVPS
ncbi:pyruvate, water dikinase regulatory protein [Oceanicella sp. SM1341]|uniref:pyruvate, water dikinase regulatory protein n=1 Tax=Oceanicella sp. SM1341 TaxID=1548889 RepID=UPI001300A7FB|nr:pyruvate, water dikinase regulatory protein [Oceanicella sp. SM1341]